MVVTKILIALPDEYKHFVSAWDSVPEEKQSVNELLSRLLIEEERFKTKEESSNDNCALWMKRKRDQKKKRTICGRGHTQKECFHNKEGKGNKLRCYYCKKPGHMQKQCRTRIRENGEGENSASSSNQVIALPITALNTQSNREAWYLDSGASEHMTPRKEWLTDFKRIKKPVTIGGTTIDATGIGDIKLETFDGKKWKPCVLKKVLYVPNLKLNLFSVSSIADKDCKIIIDKDTCRIVDNNGNTRATAERDGKLYRMKFKLKEEHALSGKSSKKTLKQWHEQLAHQNFNHVKKVLDKFNINYIENKDEFCDSCMEGKQHRMLFSSSQNEVNGPCSIISADLGGPMEVESLGGSRYFLLLKDHYSHFRVVFFIKYKSEVAEKLKIFFAGAKADTGRKIKVLRTDNGREFINMEVNQILQRYGIRHQRTVSYSPEQNGAIEREMRTIVEAARTMLHAKKVSKTLWAEAINTAVYIINRSGTSSIKDKTPYELWHGKSPDLSTIKIFGSEVFAHILKQIRRKWDSKAKKRIFVGY
ncbi:Copia protein [Ooceraea biroi]|uniref:Copia protein n=1 Tax=Ooceraea biroi TaxID=2015173 RepID=A0A026WX30_OOCBI|nr:Copia protein [Ooceraea biroi]